MPHAAMISSDLPFPVRRGKVRDVYDLAAAGIAKDAILIVATDRISAYDCIMPNGIPDKGAILTALSTFWFARFASQIDHHLISTSVADYPAPLRQYASQLAGRSMLVKSAAVVPIECVARGYLAGSGWREYVASQTVCGIKLPTGLKQCDRLPAPLFTPATKEASGHDINISFEEMISRVGAPLANELRDKTLRLYSAAADYALSRGVIIADTKFEFGTLPDGKTILIDEILTPDSSRFWPADQYEPGHDQSSFDKQYVRNWLDSQPWDKTPPAPKLPPDVVAGTRQRYADAYERLSGKRFKAT